MVAWFNCEMRRLGKAAVVEKRREIFKLIDGDVFYDMKKQPRDIEQIFWRKPISDIETFKLLMFFVGNGCPPTLINEWIMLSQFWSWSTDKCLKRARQVDFIHGNLECNRNKWFYFDLHIGRLVYMNGTVKND